MSPAARTAVTNFVVGVLCGGLMGDLVVRGLFYEALMTAVVCPLVIWMSVERRKDVDVRIQYLQARKPIRRA